MKKILIVPFLLAGFILSGCQSAQVEVPSYPPLRFNAVPAFSLDVASIETVEEYQSPLAAPNVEHLFPITPAAAVKTWVKDRLVAKGSDKNLRVVIKNASVVEHALPKTEGIKGTFTNDQASSYDAELQVEIAIYGKDPLFPESEIQVKTTPSKTISENATLNEKEALFYQMTKELTERFNQEMERNLQQYFNKYL